MTEVPLGLFHSDENYLHFLRRFINLSKNRKQHFNIYLLKLKGLLTKNGSKYPDFFSGAPF